MNGYVRIYRKIVDWEWYTDVNTKALFLHLILLANHDDKKRRGETVRRGELVTSYGSLASQTGLTFQQVRTCLKRLQSTNDITIKTTNKNTLIMVVKYDFYQSDEQTEIERINKQTNNQITNNQQSNNNQITTNKNDKNNKNIKEKEIDKEKESFSQVVLTMMIDTGDEYEITESMLKEWQQLHPKVNVLEEMQKMKAWLYANPNKRKTKRGMKRFINSWLSSSKSYSENRSSNNAEPKVPDWYKNTGETKPDDELLKQVEEMKRGLNRET